MARDARKRLSHTLSERLRHAPGGLPMDAAGWVPVSAVLAALRVTADDLDAVVRDNNKARFTVRDGMIRACQGHSLAGTPVTREALEASWSRDDSGDALWHGTSLAVLSAIAREGIVAGARSHVHLAPATDSAVGKRAGVDALLQVDPHALRRRGIDVFVSDNGVRLVREVPPGCIAGVAAGSARVRDELARIAASLGWALLG